jgi:hypothetical protein
MAVRAKHNKRQNRGKKGNRKEDSEAKTRRAKD